MSGPVSALKNACTTFCTHNAVNIAFKRRNITNWIEITLNFLKSANDCDLRVCGLVSTLENECTTFCTHNAEKIAFKRRNITNGKEITINFL